MSDLQPGDQIEIVFVEAPGQSVKATVTRFLSDRQEGFSTEVEDYINCWMEVCPEQCDALSQNQTIAFGVDWKYYLDGRPVEIRKCSDPAS